MIENDEIKQTLYADDATFFNNGSKKSFETLVNTLNDYAKCTGPYLNTTKSVIFRVGSLKETNTKFCLDKPFQSIYRRLAWPCRTYFVLRHLPLYN